ncbi:MAG TPA: DUF1232 domain-containing protein [Aggregatilineales bacterium]|nr:DUF1232 domain-containing protein [Aggregatilineales bacterium]
MKQKRNAEDNRGTMQKLFDRLTLTWRLMIDSRVSIGHKIIPPLALLYLISPLDFIPDILLPFGVIDDIGVVILALEFFIRMAPGEVVREHLNQLKQRFTTDDDGFGTGDVVDGDYFYKDNN